MITVTKPDLKVSIIMPVYKARATIQQAISSVISQTYSNWELIIVNDCCPDNSCLQVQDMIISDLRIFRIDNVTNQGVAISRNKGIAKAEGNIIAFLDSDDYWHPEKLSLQVDKIKKGYDVVCSNYMRIELNTKTKEVPNKVEFDYSDMLKSNRIGNLTGIYRSDLIGKIYQKNVGHEDYIMWLEIVKIAKKGYCIQKSLAYYRVTNNSLSSNKFQAAFWQWNVYRKEVNLSLIKSIWFFLNYSYTAYKKRQ
ncbi:glycosyltransferase family 2 protein [Psychrobacter piscatorii]|uniref:glycosyltransferase family 2 protein n=1 Tax=Psychrobacter piscatorii TaxID=554343 RepID=UPI0019187AEB|nr:glycosyltransferase family 2 protein [Psychrobacter piscatorii]